MCVVCGFQRFDSIRVLRVCSGVRIRTQSKIKNGSNKTPFAYTLVIGFCQLVVDGLFKFICYGYNNWFYFVDDVVVTVSSSRTGTQGSFRLEFAHACLPSEMTNASCDLFQLNNVSSFPSQSLASMLVHHCHEISACTGVVSAELQHKSTIFFVG